MESIQLSKRATKCSKCNKNIGYLPHGYKIEVDIVCPECAGKRVKKASKTRRTMTGNYAIAKKGVRSDVHPTYCFKSATEANFARILNYLTSTIHPNCNWVYEERTFMFDRFGYKTKPFLYVMDFIINEPYRINGYKYFEVKGYMNGSSRNKLRRLKKHYPEDAKLTMVILYHSNRKKDVEFCLKNGYDYLFYNELLEMYKDRINFE